jgi:membrane carboxypeptidase/penicillin-binding protein PbpC
MIERCDDIARCDDGTNKAVDDLVGPIIDAAPSLNEIDDMIDKGEKEFKTIMSNVEKQLRIGVKACGEYAVECALDDEAYPMTKSHRKDRGLENYNDDDHV